MSATVIDGVRQRLGTVANLSPSGAAIHFGIAGHPVVLTPGQFVDLDFHDLIAVPAYVVHATLVAAGFQLELTVSEEALITAHLTEED